jgi:hypothetical protein
MRQPKGESEAQESATIPPGTRFSPADSKLFFIKVPHISSSMFARSAASIHEHPPLSTSCRTSWQRDDGSSTVLSKEEQQQTKERMREDGCFYDCGDEAAAATPLASPLVRLKQPSISVTL